MDLIILAIVCVLTGALAGGLAGLLGVGGGIVIVPALVVLFLARGVSPDIAMHLSLGTSLASIAFTSIASICAHHKRGAVRMDLARWLAPGLIVGAALAGFGVRYLDGSLLQTGFGVFAILIGLNLLRASRSESATERPIGAARLLGGGLAIGVASGLAGIGGGSLSVPFLSYFGTPLLQAIGTAALGGLPIALGGTLGYVIGGWHAPGLPSSAVGFVDLTALCLIVPASMLAAPYGARVAHRLPTQRLRRVFAVFLLIVGVLMIWRG